MPGVLPEVHGGAVLEEHGEGPDEAFGRVQEQELGRGCRHEGHENDGGGHARLVIEPQRVDDAGGDGAKHHHTGENGGQNKGKDKPAEEEAPQKAQEAAACKREAGKGQAPRKARLIHGFTDDDGGEGYPRQYRGPRAENDFHGGHVAEHVAEGEQRGHADGGKHVEGPGKHGHAGHGHEERSLRVGGCDNCGDDEKQDDDHASNDDLDSLVPCLLLSSQSLPVRPLVGHWGHEELEQLSADSCTKENEEEEEPGSKRELGQLGEESSDVTAAGHLCSDTHRKTADDRSESLLVVLDVPDLPLCCEQTGDKGTQQESDVCEGSLVCKEVICACVSSESRGSINTEKTEEHVAPHSERTGDTPGASEHAKRKCEDNDKRASCVV